MTARALIDEIVYWLKTAILIMLLIVLAVTVLRAFGIAIPFRGIGHVELAYLAGAYWLTK